jgi:Flp pilus assembly protein TadB
MTEMTAILAAGLAVWVASGPGWELLRLRALTSPPAPAAWRAWTAVLAARLGLLTRPRRAGKAAWRRACVELCQAVVAELAAGQAPGAALVRAIAAVDAPDPAALRPVAAAARDGGDVPAALAEASRLPGCEGLRRLAACWRLSVAVGGSLTALVEGVASALREAEAHRQDLAAQLAGPRATARLLAGLPALGVLMAVALGMRPLEFLLGGPAGVLCLLAGLALDAAGVMWIHRMAATAEQAAPV